MVNKSYLNQLAIKFQTSELNVRREYAQHVLLSYLYQKKEAEDLFFKGGTALRLVHRSPRFSEDLDFDTTLHEQRVWEKVLEAVLVDMSRESIRIDILESKITSGGYMLVLAFTNIGDQMIIRLEISFRKNKIAGEIFSVQNDYISTYPIKSLQTNHLIDDKLQALMDRQKPRDFYDLYFLLRANPLTPRQKKQLPAALALMRQSKINFHQELSRFLPRSQTLIVRDFKLTLIREIERNL